MQQHNIFMDLLFVLPAIFIALMVHEISHAYTAYVFGDPTAKYQGRISLDPRVHFDPLGTVMLIMTILLPGVVFGWAKPVPVNPYNLKDPRKDGAYISLAGPMSNFAMALLAGALIKYRLVPMDSILGYFLIRFVQVNIGLGLFNLLPIPTLDGSGVLYGILPSRTAYTLMEMQRQYAMYIPFILIFLIWSGILSMIIMPPFMFLMKLFLI